MIRKLCILLFLLAFITNLLPSVIGNLMFAGSSMPDGFEQTIRLNNLYADEKAENGKSVVTKVDTVEDKEKERDRTLLIVAIVVLTVWIALSIFLFTINRRVARLEKKIDTQ